MVKYTGAGVAAPTKEVVFSDFDMDLGLNASTSDVTRLVNTDAVKQSLRNLVLTNKFERLFQPSIGGNINHYLFENISPITAHMIQTEIAYCINNYEKRVQLLDVRCTANPDENGYSVAIFYRVQNQAKADSVSILLQKVR